MSSAAIGFITPEEYLEQERRAETKSEYIQGEIFAMAGASLAHVRIVRNLSAELGNRLAAGPCEVFASELRLAVNAANVYTYPDIMVICGEPKVADSHLDTVLNPVLIIEVLSPSTENYDRGKKFESYRAIPTLQEYVTVAQDRLYAEVHTRQSDDSWLLQEVKNDGTLHLASIETELPLMAVYRKAGLAEAKQ